jgi:hypothetical protein
MNLRHCSKSSRNACCLSPTNPTERLARKKMVRQGSNESAPAWKKATASGVSGCVEVAVIGGKIAVRDSKHTDGDILTYAPNEWCVFLELVKAGTYDYFIQ